MGFRNGGGRGRGFRNCMELVFTSNESESSVSIADNAYKGMVIAGNTSFIISLGQ